MSPLTSYISRKVFISSINYFLKVLVILQKLNYYFFQDLTSRIPKLTQNLKVPIKKDIFGICDIIEQKCWSSPSVAWNSSPKKMRGGSFIGSWGTLNFHLPLGALPNGGFKFSHKSCWGQQGFLFCRDGGSLSFTGQKFAYPSPIRAVSRIWIQFPFFQCPILGVQNNTGNEVTRCFL